MPRGSDSAPPRTETPASLRDMVARARQLAAGMLDQQTITALTEFVAELEARAAALETARKPSVITTRRPRIGPTPTSVNADPSGRLLYRQRPTSWN